MHLQIESTDQITHMDGVPVRVWQGTTANGVPCLVFVHRIAVHRDQDTADFDRELAEQLPPGRVVPFSAVI